MEVSFAKNFVSFFRDHPPKFASRADSTAMMVNGKRYAYDDLASLEKLFTASDVLKYDLIEWFKMPEGDKHEWIVNFVEGTFRQEVLETRKNRAAVKDRLTANGKASLDVPDTEYILTHLQPARVVGDIRREGGFRFIDTHTNLMTNYDYHSIFYALKAGGFDKGIIEEFMSRILHIEERYEPNETYCLQKIEETNNVYAVNLYTPPKWRSLDLQPELPEEIDQLMRHLFPKDECREFVYTWIYHSLTTRCGTYLYLNGHQGTGKNTLAQIISSLHGQNNTSHPKQDSLKGRFNHFLKNKRFVFFDEFTSRSRQDKDILRTIINDRIQIEGKGRDHEDIDIHASYFLANNPLDAISLETVDRRFSVPDVTHTPIVPVFGREYMTRINALMWQDEYIGKFGRWVLENYKDPKWSAEDPYQCERFEEIVLATARVGCAETLSKVLKREQTEYDYVQEKEDFRRQFKSQTYPSFQDWSKFFREVKKDFKPLGEVRGRIFYPAARFLPANGGGDL